MQFKNFYSPLPPTENFFPRLHQLEIYLHEGCLTHETFKELFELYSVLFIINIRKHKFTMNPKD